MNGINPDAYLKEHIIRGDKGDGIPNILSDDNCMVEGVRQKPISKKKVETWINDDLSGSYHWDRNQQLIDFDFIPVSIQQDIVSEYQKTIPSNRRSGLLNYFVKNRLKMLIEHIGDF